MSATPLPNELPSSLQPPADPGAWRLHLRNLIREGVASSQFFREWRAGLDATLHSPKFTLWLRDDQQTLRTVATSETRTPHEQTAAADLEAAANSPLGEIEALTGPDLWRIPIGDSRPAIGVLELRGLSQKDGPEVALWLRDWANLLADFLLQAELRQLRENLRRQQALEQFTANLHRVKDRSYVANVVADSGPQLLQCDRVSLFEVDDSQIRWRAISGVVSVDPRAPVVQSLATIARTVSQRSCGLTFPSPLQERSTEESLAAHLQIQLCSELTAFPIRGSSSTNPVVAVVIAERFSNSRIDTANPVPLAALCEQVRVRVEAAWNAVQPRWLAEIARRIQLRNRVLATIAAVVCLLLAVIPAEIRVSATGQLQPAQRRELFAPASGIVTEILVQPGAVVPKDAVLLRLHDPHLESDQLRIEGEQQTARKKLDALQAARVQGNAASPDAGPRFQQLTAEIAEVNLLLESLAGQRQLLDQQAQQLELRSPFAGQVLTWNIDQLLTHRPVERGQRLLTVAQTDGDWNVELAIRDRDMADVSRARQSSASLPVEFVLVTNPGPVHRGELTSLSLAVNHDHPDGPCVPAIVRFEKDRLPALRPGTTVIARIDCGRASLGWVWFGKVWNAVRLRLGFWLF